MTENEKKKIEQDRKRKGLKAQKSYALRPADVDYIHDRARKLDLRSDSEYVEKLIALDQALQRWMKANRMTHEDVIEIFTNATFSPMHEAATGKLTIDAGVKTPG